MSQWHCLERRGATWKLIYHYPINTATNGSGVTYRTAIVNSGLGGTTAMTAGDGSNGTISSAEKSSVESGAVLELVRYLDITQGGNITVAADIATYIDADWTANAVTDAAQIIANLTAFGAVSAS